ncbi:DUF397 domain-containing protein [Streptomyces sp. AC495_CC817]|uniref:DUF397 domain-containing protein n=1 Tax=Streptomyces sp. AC495_CC817 TaxID=2823900 RepID=UPI001C27660C|nr:DUF397 domain-containing protein [Streptomyces sp. AC495_CC817]
MNTAESELTWFKSSYSDTEGGQCVEVASATTAVHVRDSKAIAGAMLTVSHSAWAGFVGLASSGRCI